VSDREPQKKIPPEAKVGLFVVLVIVGLAYLTTQINQSGLSFREMVPYTVYFDNVSGLLIRTPVEYNGIRAGYVEKIEAGTGPDAGVAVRIRLKPNMPIYEDSDVQLQTRGLLGEKIIMISKGGKGAQIPVGGVIRDTKGAAGVDDAMEKFSEVADAIKDFIKGGNGLPSIQDVINNTTDITENLQQVIKGRRDDLEKIVDNMKVVTEAVRKFVDTNDPKDPGGFQNLKLTMERLDRTVASLQEIVQKIERGEGTVGKLLNDETTVNKMNDALDNFNEFVGEVKSLEIAVGFRGEYMYDSEDPIAVTSFRFRPAKDKYFLLEFTDGPLSFGKLSKTTTTTTTSPPGTSVTEEKRTRKDDFSLTAVFARRFYDLTLKAGLFRSTGYFGAEYHLFHDHLSLALDAFNFSRESRPQLRAYAQYQFFKIFRLNAGVDDIINPDGDRNYFAGLGFIVTDEDIKKLFGIAPLLSSN